MKRLRAAVITHGRDDFKLKRIVEGADIILCRTRRRLLLVMGIVCALGVVVAHFLEFSLIAQLALVVVSAAAASIIA